jgi:hypothetical protein
VRVPDRLLVDVHEAVQRLLADAALERLTGIGAVVGRNSGEIHLHHLFGAELPCPILGLDVVDGGLDDMKGLRIRGGRQGRSGNRVKTGARTEFMWIPLRN